MKIEEGVMLVKNHKGWGEFSKDSRSASSGWMSLDEATIHNPEYCKIPEDITYANSPDIPELNKGKLVWVKRCTLTTIGGNPLHERES